MNSSFRSLRDALLLFLWGTFVLWLDFSKLLSTYLHPSLQPYTVGAGVALIVLALFSLRGLLKKKDAEEANHHDHSCCHHHSVEDHDHHAHDHDEHDCEETDHHHHGAHEDHGDCAHDHSHGDATARSLIFKSLVLLVPLTVVLLGHNNHYTMSMINNRGVVQDLSKIPAANKTAFASVLATAPATNAASSKTADANPASSAASNAPMPIQVVDLLYAVQMPTYREEFEGKQVELIGQFVPLTVKNPKGDRFQVIRLFITCCAADAAPIGVTVQYDKPLKASEMSWLKITGTPTFPMEGGRRTALLVATKVEECPAPAEPFVY
jgi:uncharacterized repeat protein (TIGR03943 family)